MTLASAFIWHPAKMDVSCQWAGALMRMRIRHVVDCIKPVAMMETELEMSQKCTLSFILNSMNNLSEPHVIQWEREKMKKLS